MDNDNERKVNEGDSVIILKEWMIMKKMLMKVDVDERKVIRKG